MKLSTSLHLTIFVSILFSLSACTVPDKKTDAQDFYIKTLTFMDWNEEVSMGLVNNDSAKVISENMAAFRPMISQVLTLLKSGEIPFYSREMTFTQFANPPKDDFMKAYHYLIGDSLYTGPVDDSLFMGAFETICKVSYAGKSNKVEPLYLQLNGIIPDFPMINTGFISFKDLQAK